MLENMMLLVGQMAVMLLLMGVGMVCYRIHYLDDTGTGQLSMLLNRIIAPSVIINSFRQPFDTTLAQTLLITAGCTALYFVIAITLSHLCFRKNKPGVNSGDKRFCAVFTNCGFMALPLLDALFGSYGLMLGAAIIVVNNLMIWSYGVSLLTQNVTMRQRITGIVLNPGTVSVCIGLILFLTPATLPTPVGTAVEYLAALNTPVAMIVLGVFLAQCNLRTCFTDREVYQVTALRLLVISGIFMALLLLLPLDNTVRAALLISVSAPVAMASPMFARVYGTDYLFSTRAVAVSTLLSVVTIPVLNALLGLLS